MYACDFPIHSSPDTEYRAKQHSAFMWYSNDYYWSSARTASTVKEELSLSQLMLF